MNFLDLHLIADMVRPISETSAFQNTRLNVLLVLVKFPP